jgi:hypothetical protein
MVSSARLAPLVGLLVLLGACSDADNPAGPGGDPVPTGPPVIQLFSVSRDSVDHGDWIQLSWKIDGARNASITPNVGLVSPLATGAASVRPVETLTYTLTAFNDHGSIAQTVDVVVSYRAGVYVDKDAGDDANSGSSPQEAVATLSEAFARTTGGGAIFVAAGTYDVNLVIDGPRRLVYGGLNPETFLQEAPFRTTIRPAGGVPLVIEGGFLSDPTVLDHLNFETETGGTHVMTVDGSKVVIEDCFFDGAKCGSGTAVRLTGGADVTMLRSRVRGGGDLPGAARPSDASGIHVAGGASLLARNCFISGGYALSTSSGVDVDTDGTVALGLNTISAAIPATGDFATAVRIRHGNPAIGGNILATRGAGRRPIVIEDSADSDPAWFHANLVLTGGSPVYDNFSGDGADPATEEGLNNYQLVTGVVGTVGDNLLPTGVAPSNVFEAVDNFDYHLVHPMPGGGANPAVNSFPREFNFALYGIPQTGRLLDIDGDARPSMVRDLDRGADEF